MTAEHSKLRIFIIFLILVFPTLCNLVEHAGSVILTLLFVLGLSVCFPKKKRPILVSEEKWIMWAFVSYLAAYLFSFMFNGILGNLQDPRLKFIDHELRFLAFIPIFFLLKKNQIPKPVLWFSIIIACIISGSYAIVNKIFIAPEARTQGAYHSIGFGHICLSMAFISIAGLEYFQKRKTVWVIAPLSAFVLGLAGAVLSGTRGAWIAIPPLLVVAFFQFRKDFSAKVWATLIIIICAAAFVSYKSPATGIAQRLQDSYREICEYNAGNLKNSSFVRGSSFGERIEGWLAASHIFLKYPIVGAGPGNFEPYVKEMISQGKRSKIIAKYSQPHNIYLAVMADCGVLGLTALLAIFLIPLWFLIMMIKKCEIQRNVGYAGIFLISSFMMFGLTETIFGRNIYICFYIIMLSVILTAGTGSDDQHGLKETPSD